MTEQYFESGITVSREGPVQTIKFDNISLRNAISIDAYTVIERALKEAKEDDSVLITVLTGAGNYYSSGNNFTTSVSNDISLEDAVEKNVKIVKDFVDTLIDYPKLLIAIVNGPAIGIAVTTLGLCDIVFATDNATFKTPFTKIGVCAEGCSSYTFPIILGTTKANQMLLLNYEMSATEALNCGLVSKIYKPSEMEKIWTEIKTYGNLPAGALQANKGLIRRFQTDKLHIVNKIETDVLAKRLLSEDFMNFMVELLNRKKKSKL